MKKRYTLILFIFFIFCSNAFASKHTERDDLLLEIKGIIEKHFSGTKYRGIQKDFQIDDSLSNGYKFYGNATKFIVPSKLKKINHQLNIVLKKKMPIKLGGKIYFDFFLDSVIVALDYRTEYTIYKFVAMSHAPVPPKGYLAFSKRMHDFLKDQLANNKVSKDSIKFVGSTKFIAKADGRVSASKQGYLTDALNDFLKAEKRWNPGLHSGPIVNAKVSFILDRQYLLEDTNWPPYYGEEQISIESLASFSTTENEVFYTNMLPRGEKETILSVVYDSTLKAYRLPYTHVDHKGEAKKLIAMIMQNGKIYGEDTFEFERKYYYTYFNH